MSSLESSAKPTSSEKKWFEQHEEDSEETTALDTETRVDLEEKAQSAEHDFTIDELNPRRSCMQRLFLLIRFIAIMGSLAMATGQLVEITYGVLANVEYVLRVYMIIFCFVMIVNELKCTRFVSSGLLSNWITRGAIYTFVGVIGIQENNVDEYGDVVDKAALAFIEIVAW
eukprot:CAMPEP_0194354196 /NCGR_PEP_ID=MMETSP0174-20130528/2407_1 /TAXON_ID=216777 /ORGANISM="Proboscia alata, Strain PI-D3" /LENGTH=170 /DNA_ID=CAMNT_0039123055 /DNA_START=14 /DNA_END=523 /DNA_ORIENTATION=-